jgi:ATP/maltotriose-dependent transcriptional regulator MalT
VQRHDRLARIVEQDVRADRAGDRTLLAQESMRMTMAGEPARTAADLATRALRGRHLMHEEGSGGSLFSMAVSTLLHTDRDAEAFSHLDAGLEHARRRGAVLEHATLAYTRSLLHERRGRLRLAQADLESALAARDLGWRTFVEISAHVLVRVHLARGDVDAARPLLDLMPLDSGTSLWAAVNRQSHAAIAVVDGDGERALALLAEAGEHAESFRGPAFTSWRREGIAVAMALGRETLARSWADEEVRAADAFGSPRFRAFALQAAAAAYPFERAVPMLREAISLLGRVEGRLVLALAHHDLARLLLDQEERRPERRDEAIELARRGLALADQVGAEPLARDLSDLLAGTDTEVERSDSLVDLLTASELKVCELAVQGLSNRQIAEHLFVTVKGVEWHLSKSYAKLGISSRRELASHLRDASELA